MSPQTHTVAHIAREGVTVVAILTLGAIALYGGADANTVMTTVVGIAGLGGYRIRQNGKA